MKSIHSFITVVVLLAGTLSNTWAQVTAFSYQSRLSESNSPANGSYDISFTLFDALSDGVMAGNVITNPAVAISNGIVAVTLDFGAEAFNGAARWLEIAVRPAGTSDAYSVLAPRQPITSVPYAIRALTATAVPTSNLVGNISSALIDAGSIDASRLASNSVTTASIAPGAVTGAKIAPGLSSGLTTTFTNPIPQLASEFGATVAFAGGDMVAIAAPAQNVGATAAGVVYLFAADGTLVMPLTNPAPIINGRFGSGLAAVGSDRLAVGMILGVGNPGATYLYDLSGTLLRTFPNPTPEILEQFGAAITAVGTDQLIISAPGDNTGTNRAGAAYRFNLNGTLLNSFTNPTPRSDELFGATLAMVGTDKVLVGAPSAYQGTVPRGAAYLFALNGSLLTTYTNPSIGLSFGSSLAGVGNDKVLIGAWQDGTLGSVSGAAYLFDLNGNLLTTYHDPTPFGDNFGFAVASVGNDKVLIGARRNRIFPNTTFFLGAAYVFDLNGTLLSILDNPDPPALFGSSVSAFGEDKFLVGDGDEAVYLFEGFSPGVSSYSAQPGSVTSASVLDGTIATNDLDHSLLHETFWRLDGNATSTSDFLGTRNGQPLELRVNNLRALRLEPTSSNDTVNLVGGSARNFVPFGVVGAAIGGGGSGNFSGVALTNSVRASFGTIAGGAANVIGPGSLYGVISGGSSNQIATNAPYAIIPGGVFNFATNFAFAAGRRAKAIHTGAFVWGDSTESNLLEVPSTNANSVTMRAAGGYRLFSNAGITLGVYLAPNGGSWTTLSDRNLKENIEPVDPRAVLDKVVALPVSTWNYKGQAEGIRHIGPMAQDFKTAFQVGEGDTGITTVDADGVALAAIQGLNEKLEKQAAQLQAQSAELESLKKLVTHLEELLVKSAR